MKKRWLWTIAVMLLVCLSGCSWTTPSTNTGQAIAVGFLTDGGTVEDGGINQTVWTALQKLAQEQQGMGISCRVPNTDGSYADCVQQLKAQGCSLILCADSTMADVVCRIAQSEPDLKFVLIDCSDCGGLQDNLCCLSFATEQGLYLSGYVAGKVTQSGRIGCVYSRMTPQTEKYLAAFLAGVRSGDPQASLLRSNALFSGEVRTAESLIANGVDVIFHADQVGITEVVKTCEENGIRAVCISKDENQQSDAVLIHVKKNIAYAVTDIVRQAALGTFTAGIHTYDPLNGGIALEAEEGLLSEGVLTGIKNRKEQLSTGEIRIPATLEELESAAVKE